MKYQYLTPEDQLLLDPYGINRNAILRIPLSDESFNSPSQWFNVTPDEAQAALQHIRTKLNCPKHKPYFDYMDEMDSKWGPQGGCFSRKEMVSILTNYYENASHQRVISHVLRQGRDFLLQRIRQVIRDYGYPQVCEVPRYRTNAACPTGLKKGDYLAETTGAKPWRHMYPAVPGQRRMRNSNRLIFQDSVLNVRYIERELTAVRNWLKTHFPEYFGAWCNPKRYVNPMLTDALIHHNVFLETDYVKMDQHFSWQLTAEIILPIYECLIPDSYLSIGSAVEELFTQPVYMGDYCYTGLHNLFSGESITNDFETIYTVCLYLGVALELHCLEDTRGVFIGDDCTIAIKTSSNYLPRKFRDLMISVSNAADMVIHDDEKSRIVRGETRFCRKVYYIAGAKDIDNVLLGAYPLNLALNNIIQPEKSQSKAALAAVADIQRMDNCYGAPGYTELVQYLFKHSTHKFAQLSAIPDTSDWWYRLYGESWKPDESPTVRLMQSGYSQHHDGFFYTLC